ncbi:hypothetical protein N9C35_03630, partial [Flavobacteriaceae bacterium]|nr:hypothetical protein [Flavobacteriaceae bacterium]
LNEDCILTDADGNDIDIRECITPDEDNNALWKLDLSSRNISEIPVNFFAIISNIRISYKNDDEEEVESTLARQISIIDLSNNRIKDISSDISLFKNVWNLNFENNKIETIPDQILKMNTILEFNIKQNPIEPKNFLRIRDDYDFKNLDKGDFYYDSDLEYVADHQSEINKPLTESSQYEESEKGEAEQEENKFTNKNDSESEDNDNQEPHKKRQKIEDEKDHASSIIKPKHVEQISKNSEKEK